jgi:hypothetical protein
MQWSALTEETQKNQLAQTGFRFIKNNNNNKGGAITCRPSPLYQRCTAAKDGQLQGGLFQQTYAVECID